MTATPRERHPRPVLGRRVALAVVLAGCSLPGPALAAPAPVAPAPVAPAPVAQSGESSPATPPAVPATELLRLADRQIAESSGLALSSRGDMLYMHQDAGRPREVFGVDTRGATRLIVRFPDIEGAGPTSDWEDVALARDEAGAPVLVLGDIGDGENVRAEPRTSFTLLRIAEPELPDPGGLGATAPPPVIELTPEQVQTWELRYADGRARNAEALAVHPVTQQVVVVDKSRRTAVWAAEPGFGQPSPGILERVADIDVNRVSGAAFSRDGRQFVVRDQTTAYLWDTSAGSLEEALGRPPRTVPLPSQRQGESVTFSVDGTSLLVGSEGARTAVWAVPLADDAPPALAAPTPGAPSTGPTAAEVEQSARQEVRLLSGLGAAAVLALLVPLGLRQLRARRRHDRAQGAAESSSPS